MSLDSRRSCTVLLIGGTGRSGSTLLERMLDQVDDVVAVGELADIWHRGLTEDERCGCGKPFRACPFWDEVGQVAFGGWRRIDDLAILALKRSLTRNRQLPFLVGPSVWPGFKQRLDAYTAVLQRLYFAIATVSNRRVIVDASKWPTHTFVVRRIRRVDLRLLHLVRDPQAVAYSWSKKTQKPHSHGRQPAYMQQYHPASSAVRWTAFNAATDLATSLGVPTRVFQYEQLIRSPTHVIRAALQHAGIDAASADLSFVRDKDLTLSPGHGIAGNPVRFKHGTVPLSLDEEWRHRMPWRHRVLVSTLTAPLELLYSRRSKAPEIKAG